MARVGAVVVALKLPVDSAIRADFEIVCHDFKVSVAFAGFDCVGQTQREQADDNENPNEADAKQGWARRKKVSFLLRWFGESCLGCTWQASPGRSLGSECGHLNEVFFGSLYHVVVSGSV